MVKIVADTTSGLPREMLKTLGIPLIPQIVCFGEDSFRDDTELDTAAFLQKLKASTELPKTAAPPPALYHPIFEQALKDGEDVVVVAPSARSAGRCVRQKWPHRIFRNSKWPWWIHRPSPATWPVWSCWLTNGLSEGANADTIVSRLNEWIPRGHIFFLVDTLEYLQKGGRIGGAKALLGEMLQIKPILCLKNGQVEPFEQQRTKRRALARLLEVVEEQCPKGPEAHLCVMQADAAQEAGLLAADLKSRMNLTDIPIYELPPAIVTHGGPGVLGIGFFVA